MSADDDTLTNPEGRPKNGQLRIFWQQPDASGQADRAASVPASGVEAFALETDLSAGEVKFFQLALGRYEHASAQWLPYTETLGISLESDCLANEQAELVFPSSALTLGFTEIGYRPSESCIKDKLVVKAQQPGLASRPLVVDVLPPAPRSVNFSGFYLTPGQPYELPEEASQIELKPANAAVASGLPENLYLKYQVSDISGNPVAAGWPLDLALYFLTDPSGLTMQQKPNLVTNEAVTNALGEAWVEVRSGTQPLMFKVLAGLRDTERQASSPQLAVSSVFADLENTQLLAAEMNLEESPFIYQVTFALPDTLGNPLKDSSRVEFSVSPEQGFSQSQCQPGVPAAGLCTLEAYLSSRLTQSEQPEIITITATTLNQQGETLSQPFDLQYTPGEGVFPVQADDL